MTQQLDKVPSFFHSAELWLNIHTNTWWLYFHFLLKCSFSPFNIPVFVNVIPGILIIFLLSWWPGTATIRNCVEIFNFLPSYGAQGISHEGQKRMQIYSFLMQNLHELKTSLLCGEIRPLGAFIRTHRQNIDKSTMETLSKFDEGVLFEGQYLTSRI